MGFMVLKITQDFNTKIVFEMYTPSPEILAKMYPNLAFQAKSKKILTFLAISQDSVPYTQ